MPLLRALAFTLAAVVATSAAGQSLPRFGAPEKHVDAELIAATDAIVPGQPLTVGLRLKARKRVAYVLAGAGRLRTADANQMAVARGLQRRRDRLAASEATAGRAVDEFRVRGRNAAADDRASAGRPSGRHAGDAERKGIVARVQGRLHSGRCAGEVHVAGQAAGRAVVVGRTVQGNAGARAASRA